MARNYLEPQNIEHGMSNSRSKNILTKNNSLSLATILQFISFSVFSLVLSGCVSGRVYPISQQFDITPNGICRVAVLPFINKSEYLLGDIAAYRIFMAELTRSTKFRVALEGDIRKAYRRLKITATTVPDPEQMKIMAERLKVEAIIVGEVISMGEDIQGGSSLPHLTLHLNFIDARTGKVFQTIYHRRNGDFYRKIMHFGMINNITRLTQIISHEIIDLWSKQGLQSQCGR